MRLPLLSVLAVLALAAAGCDKTRVISTPDSGPLCGLNERLVNGDCLFVCSRDGQCPSGERCNLFSGQCETKPPAPDAGPRLVPCTEGADRCSADSRAVERCQADGGWAVSQSCPSPDGFCQGERCLSCRPGATRCAAGSSTTLEICRQDGSGFRTVTCQGAATCVVGECAECATGQKRCSPDGRAVQECRRSANEALTWGWANNGDNFDGTCITQQCNATSGQPACVAPACVPGATQCLNATTQQQCNTLGAWANVACSSVPGMGPAAECQNGACIDECADAVRARSYYGCEYWSAVLDNSMDSLFKGRTTSGQGTADSDFVFVVTNQSVYTATVEVWRWVGSAAVRVKQVQVPGRNDAATKGLVKIPVPWQSIGPASLQTGLGASGRARYGYRLTSSRPITVYQFSPIDAVKFTKTCTGAAGQMDCNCDEYSDYDFTTCFVFGGTGGTCTQTASGKRCGYGTFSNDASLLLPAHILGTSYVTIGANHVQTQNNPISAIGSPTIAIVATQDNTQVTIRSTAATVNGGATLPAFARGETRTITMSAYEVVQLATDNVTGANLECIGGWCRVGNDFTGTVVSSTAPVAVFSGSPCAQNPFNRQYCDHLEEQIFPFATWGKNFVAIPSHPLRLNNNSFPATSAAPDHFKIVAACPVSQCPSGTTITLSAAPSAANVLAPNNCLAGTSLSANNCRLAGGGYVEFKSSVAFAVAADQPIAIAQFLPGQGTVTGASTDPQQGDPSMILLPPVEQWRTKYTVLASTGLKDNYLALAIDSSKVASVLVDGVAININPGGAAPSDPKAVAGTNYVVKNHAVTTGTHTIQVNAKPGQTVLPGAGVTIYGYDAQVSYGYTGGLDLGSIVTGINPGG